MAIQVAGEQYYELDGQLSEIKRQLRQPAGYPFDPMQLKVALQNAIEGKFGKMRKQSWLSVVATFNLDAVDGKPTQKCFVDKKRYYYRDDDFDNQLPANQPRADGCVISTLGSSRNWTFAEAATTVLDIGAGTDTALLGKLLIEHGHTMTLAQAEKMVEKTEDGEKTGMCTDGYGNFAFVETGNSEDPVSVARVGRAGRWSAYVGRLGGGGRWCADGRLLVRNLDTSKL